MFNNIEDAHVSLRMDLEVHFLEILHDHESYYHDKNLGIIGWLVGFATMI
jgi:hypothetical protein